mgnify:CR=1 FL=1
MIEFNASSIMWRNQVTYEELESWLFNNVGPGGRWLHGHNGDEIEPELGDEWGTFSRVGYIMITIVDKQKAVWFKLRWS